LHGRFSSTLRVPGRTIHFFLSPIPSRATAGPTSASFMR